MKQIIYLVATRNGVDRFRKEMPTIGRGEIPIKVHVEIEDSAFRTPTIEKELIIGDWREGIDMPDVNLKEMTITEKEAEQLREQRKQALIDEVEKLGYKVVKADEV